MNISKAPAPPGTAGPRHQSDGKSSVYFKEKQVELDPRNWYIAIALAIFCLGVGIYGIFHANLHVNDVERGDWFIIDHVLVIGVPLFLAFFLPWWFYRRLQVRVGARNITISMRLWSTRSIPLDSILHWEVRVYHTRPGSGRSSFLRRIRSGLRAVYAINGILGVQIELANGQKVLIGSQHPERLAEAIRKAKGA